MAPTPPSGRRRRRESGIDGNGDDLPTSAKRRRLAVNGASSPSTPRALDAITSAISNAFGIGRRRLSTKDDLLTHDRSYEVPDSEDELNRAAKKKKKRAPNSAASGTQNSAYDGPVSGDSGGELQTTSVTPRKRKRKPSTKLLASLEASGAISGAARHGSGQRSNRREGDERRSEVNADVVETPTARRFRKDVGREATGKDLSENDGETPSREPPYEGRTGSLRRGSGKTGKHTPEKPQGAAPKLRGILTPQRNKDGSRRGAGTGKSNGRASQAEVHFDDLPTTNSAKSGGLSKKSESRIRLDEAEDEAVSRSDDEEEDEDDEVCQLCSKPDSEPPNEIIFCDSCDMAVHQECYGVPVIPNGDWLCRDCSQDTHPPAPETREAAQTTTATGAAEEIPDIANFEEHFRSMQRVLLARCAGRRPIKLRGQEEARDKVFQLVEQTVLAGEGNSMLVIGARGSGKTTLVETVISELSKNSKDAFHVVRLNGFIHTDDKLALKEIWRQLGKEMQVDDELVNKTHNYADTLQSLLALLSHPSEISESQDGITSMSVVFVIDEFDLFATHARQTLLYNLFDIAQARKAPIAVLGLTTRVDVVESLEKRVKSRFSHRYVYLSLPKSLPAYWDICRQGLTVDGEDMVAEGIDSQVKGHRKFWEYWNEKIEALHRNPDFQSHLEFYFYSTKSVPEFLVSCLLPLASITPAAPTLKFALPPAMLSAAAPDSKLHILEGLADLELSLLIAAARLDIVAHTDTVNFAMAYDEYSALMGRQRLQTASAGMLALGGGSRVWGRGVAGAAWERLTALGLLIPATAGRGGGGAGHGGLEARMWKVDVALEEIPGAVKLNSVLARWCREI